MTDPLPHGQAAHRVRFDWARAGAEHVEADTTVVVDVLSFTTTLTLAVEKGIEVFPHDAYDIEAKKLAMRHGATLALRRFEALGHPDGRHVSLSPASLLQAEGIDRLVLPNPNGSAVSSICAARGDVVLAACLRNASSVAEHLHSTLGDRGSVVVIAAGEQWPDGTLRPAVEDLWGAGAVLSALATHLGGDQLSPEARMAAQTFEAVKPRLHDEMRACASGVELAQTGFVEDVEIAAAHDVSAVVPHLVGTSFAPASPR